MEKAFKNYDELLDILSSRGVDLSTTLLKSNAKKYLQHEGYYNLINGYKAPFLKRDADGRLLIPDSFRDGTTVDEIGHLYQFDAALRLITLKNILVIERNIKNLVAHSFSKYHGHKNYLIYSNFDTSQRDATEKITSLISEIQRQLSSRVSDPSIKHYLTHHGYVPLWVLNNILSFGLISKFYSLMKQPERQEISKVFGIQDHELSNLLIYLSSVRNVCAHSNRLYCFRTKRPIIDLDIHSKLKIPENKSGEFEYGKRDLFALMIIFNAMLSKGAFRAVLKETKKELETLYGSISVLSKQDILKNMGFPDDWYKKLLSLIK